MGMYWFSLSRSVQIYECYHPGLEAVVYYFFFSLTFLLRLYPASSEEVDHGLQAWKVNIHKRRGWFRFLLCQFMIYKLKIDVNI